GEYLPVLAESYDELTESNSLPPRIVNVKLKDSIFWEDGKPITSQDIHYTWQKISESDSSFGYRDQFNNIENIEIINDKEFKIVFKEKMDNWQELFNVIFPSHGVIEEGNQINLFEDYTFGCGTYKILEWVKGDYILLERNIYSTGKVPEIKYIKFLFNSDINKLISGLKGGDIDVLSVPADIELLNEIEENENLDLLIREGNLWEHLAICLKPKEE
ncbi:MAG: ABC transporter substrate-binding protein, partial [Candidatus Humimicrobiaceae bacterium]